RVLILNPDPVFKDRLLSILDLTDWTETRVVRSLSEAVTILIAERFDGFIIEGEPESAVETATVTRQHFPSLKLLCVPWERPSADSILNAQRQHIPLANGAASTRWLRAEVRSFLNGLDRDRKSTRLNSSHRTISYAVFCLKKKKN